MGGLLHLVQRVGAWAGWALPSPLLAVPNVTANPSTASIPITVLLHNGLLLCGFNVVIEWLNGHIKTAEQRTQRAQAPPRCTKCNSPPVNGQRTNFILFDVAL